MSFASSKKKKITSKKLRINANFSHSAFFPGNIFIYGTISPLGYTVMTENCKKGFFSENKTKQCIKKNDVTERCLIAKCKHISYQL